MSKITVEVLNQAKDQFHAKMYTVLHITILCNMFQYSYSRPSLSLFLDSIYIR